MRSNRRERGAGFTRVDARELGPAIAEGRTAVVHAFGAEQVIKAFRDEIPKTDALIEAAICRAVSDLNLPMPRFVDIVEISGGFGLVFDRIDGLTMVDGSAGNRWRYARLGWSLGRIHVRLHAVRAPQGTAIPAQKTRLREKIDGAAEGLTAELRAAAIARLDALPSGDRICHGDFHPENVLIADGQTFVIDWIDAAIGSPLGDVARTVVLVWLNPLPDRTRDRLQGWLRRSSFLGSYLAAYFLLSRRSLRALRAWMPVVAAGRLRELKQGETARLRAYLERALRKTPLARNLPRRTRGRRCA